MTAAARTPRPWRYPLGTAIRRLRLHGEPPCGDALGWIKALPKTITPQQAWDTCPRADWMLWYVEACGVGGSR